MNQQTDQLLKNINRWAYYCPKEANSLLKHRCKTLSFCTTKEGEPNLKQTVDDRVFYYHSPEGAMKEAREWFASLDLYRVKTLFVYGVGLGYYHRAARTWLQEDSKRDLVFLEDDLDVIYRLLETDLGAELLNAERTRLYYLAPDPKGNITEESFTVLPAGYFLSPIAFSVLQSYQKEKAQQINQYRNFLDFLKEVKTSQQMEHMTFGKGFFRNFYRNMLDLPSSKSADQLFSHFRGVPAIICGAGPSLEKHLPVVETLKDRALIFAGGSAINTVGTRGFLPHFGVTIDPNISQYSRLFMSQAFEVPFFYRNRVFPEALILLHGEHLYVSGSEGYGIAKWFEEKLGIEGREVSEGNNVVNFSLAIAEALGCSPIILVGADFAYSEQRSYSPGIQPHPILDVGRTPVTRSQDEELIEKKDIYGRPVLTLWKWITGSVWITQFATTHPECKLINATEGGIGIEGVPNLDLAEVEKKYLKHSLDLTGWIHAVIQQSVFPESVSTEKVIVLLEELKGNLRAAKKYCEELRNEFDHILNEIKEKGSPQNLISGKALELLKKLNQEPCYKAILSRFNESFVSFYGREDLEELYEDSEMKIDQTEINKRRTVLNKRRYEFLKAVCNTSISHIKGSLEEDRIRNLIASTLAPKPGEERTDRKLNARQAVENLKKATYSYEGGRIQIEDKELGISFEGNIITEPVLSLADPLWEKLGDGFSGKLELCDSAGSLILEQFYQEGKLHGPSRAYASQGNRVAESWYLEGKKVGRAVFYYPSGALYSIQRFKEDLWEGKQEYFYPDGGLKTSLEYHLGTLHGKTCLYFPSGVMKRKVYFSEGKREGFETIWNIGGIKESEVEYHEDKPIGPARAWHLNGQVAKEIIYDADGKACSIRAWTADGILLPAEVVMREDYFDKVTRQTGVLTESIQEIYTQINALTEQLALGKADSSAGGLTNDLQELRNQMDQMNQFYQKMLEIAHGASDTTKEAIWKNPQTRRLLGKQLEEATDKMVNEIQAIEEVMKLTNELLKKPIKEERGADE